LIEAIFPAALDDLLGGQTDAGVGLEQLLRDNAETAGLDLFLLLKL